MSCVSAKYCRFHALCLQALRYLHSNCHDFSHAHASQILHSHCDLCGHHSVYVRILPSNLPCYWFLDGGTLNWDPLRLIDNWDNHPAVFFAAFSFVLSTMWHSFLLLFISHTDHMYQGNQCFSHESPRFILCPIDLTLAFSCPFTRICCLLLKISRHSFCEMSIFHSMHHYRWQGLHSMASSRECTELLELYEWIYSIYCPNHRDHDCGLLVCLWSVFFPFFLPLTSWFWYFYKDTSQGKSRCPLNVSPKWLLLVYMGNQYVPVSFVLLAGCFSGWLIAI